MKATGIVRRIDDLGRVVIPREIRRAMRIKEGDPLELFTTREGEVIFKKYQPFEEKDWAKAKRLVQVMYPELKFALYDDLGEKQVGTYADAPQVFEDEEDAIYNDEHDLIGYIHYNNDDILIATAERIEKMLGEFFSTNL
jgi:AbrB family looped-hinge helix DNA binding protein